MAVAAGADCIGVILAPGYSRSQPLDQALAVFGGAGAAVRVGVFVDATVDEMLHAARTLGLFAVQLHGDEPAEVLGALRGGGFEVWKAVRVREPARVVQAAATYGEVADALLLDGWSAVAHGGTGAQFDWDGVAALRASLPATLRLVVAGGLDPANVAGVVSRLRPDVVDVSSGVEESPCRKSAERVRAFIAAVRGVEDLQ
jgi:phosphoribosylanthranilate isomerase